MRTSIVALSLMPCVIAMGCRTPTTDISRHDLENIVKVKGSGDGDGTVVAPDPNVLINCHISGGWAPSGDRDSGCEAGFNDAGGGAQVGLSATPDAGHLFGGWSGDYCSGTGECWLTFPAGSGPFTRSATASFLFIPGELQVDMGTATLDRGQSTTATATADPALPDTAVYEWTSSDPSVAAVSPDSPSSTATLIAVGVGTATITAMARTRVSDPVAITVEEPPPEPGSLQGTVTDEAGTGVEGLVVRIGGPTPSRTATDTDGKYSATELQAGSYTVYVQGVSGLRYLSTEVHQVGVQAGSSTVEDITTTEGHFLRVESGQGDRQVAAGATATIDLEFLVWNRSGCPACEPALILGVDGEPMVLHRFGSPGAYPGTSYTASLQVTAPAQAGTYQLYAMLVTGISTGSDEGKEAALTAYRDRYGNGDSGGVWVETFVPLGSLTVN